jgi:hypothetical protein
MSEYGMCECYGCSRRVTKAEAHRDTIEIESGRSGGGFGIGLRGLRFYSGRTYYRKKEIWLCHDCYLARSGRRRIRPAPAPAPAPAVPGEIKYLAALQARDGYCRSAERGSADRDRYYCRFHRRCCPLVDCNAADFFPARKHRRCKAGRC